MENHEMLARLGQEMLEEVSERILPYWAERAIDRELGGFVGRITHFGERIEAAPKGSVLNARILWSFSEAGDILKEPQYLLLASRAHDYLEEHLRDEIHGGYYWTVSKTGEPLDTTKKIYAQAFVLYGLSRYFRASGDSGLPDKAIELFRIIEANGHDDHHGGYLESFSRSWQPIEDMRLGDTDDNAPKSMNTNLHVLEAYIELFRSWPDVGLRNRLAELVEIFLTKIYDTEAEQLKLFFEDDWTPRSSTFSYGHDIETSWLIQRAGDLIGDAELSQRIQAMSIELARKTATVGLDRDGGVFWSSDRSGPIDTDKHHWVQAEAVLGFATAYFLTGEEHYARFAERVWAYTKSHIIDRGQGEWFGRVNRDGVPYETEDKVGLWKCPYHNTRACLKMTELTKGILAE